MLIILKLYIYKNFMEYGEFFLNYTLFIVCLGKKIVDLRFFVI